MSNKIFCLRNIQLYRGIPEKDLIKVMDKAVEAHFEKDHVFYCPQNPAKNVYILKAGEIELYREENGKKIVIETLFPGDVFGDFGTGKSTHCAKVNRRSYICCTPTNEFLKTVKSHPEIAFNLMQALAEKTADYEEKIAAFSQPASVRILSELKRIAHKNSRKILGKFFKIPLRISHQKLANQAGLNRVTVTKIMNQLQNEKKIEVDDNGVITLL